MQPATVITFVGRPSGRNRLLELRNDAKKLTVRRPLPSSAFIKSTVCLLQVEKKGTFHTARAPPRPRNSCARRRARHASTDAARFRGYHASKKLFLDEDETGSGCFYSPVSAWFFGALVTSPTNGVSNK